MARFLVTGGAGFIGSHLVDALLNAGHHVRVIDDLSTGKLTNLNTRAEFLRGDIADTALMQSAMQGITGCFHLAAIASVARCTEAWLETHRTNMAGTITVFDACRSAGNVPVVYASSAAVYGTQTITPIAETALCAPRSAYGADKLGNELHAAAAHVTSGLPSVGMRFFNVYGPHQDPFSPYSGVISIFANRMREDLPLTIYGDGGQTRDFVFVTDIVRFLAAAMTLIREMPQVLVLNACTGAATRISDLPHVMAAILGTHPLIAHKPQRDGDIHTSIGDPTFSHAVLGLRATVALGEGLARLLN